MYTNSIGLILMMGFLSGCGVTAFVEPKVNPVLEDEGESLRTIATTGERRLTYVRKTSVNLDEVDDTRLIQATSELSDGHRNNSADRPNEPDPDLIHIGRFGGREGEFCAEPSPDAIESVANTVSAAFSGSSNLSNKPDQEARLEFAKSLATNTASVFRRSQGIQLYRDGAFFLCQAMMNGYIDAYEYRKALIYLRHDAVKLTMKELETATWNEAPLIIVESPQSPPAPKPGKK